MFIQLELFNLFSLKATFLKYVSANATAISESFFNCVKPKVKNKNIMINNFKILIKELNFKTLEKI